MKVTLDVPDYDPNHGVLIVWDNDYVVDVKIAHQAVYVNGNKPALISLARLLLTLAQDEVSPGLHIHLDSFNGLDPGSDEIVFGKI